MIFLSYVFIILTINFILIIVILTLRGKENESKRISRTSRF